MQYVHSSSELAQWRRTGAFLARFTGAEMMLVLARTDPTAAAAVLPKPLQAPKDPVISAFVAHYPETNFGVDYYLASFFSLGLDATIEFIYLHRPPLPLPAGVPVSAVAGNPLYESSGDTAGLGALASVHAGLHF